MSKGRVAFIAVAVCCAALVLGAAGFVVVIAVRDRPPPVPPGFRPPASLPATTVDVAVGSLLYDSDRTGSFEIYLADRPGASPRRLTEDRDVDSWWPRLSPGRDRVLFYRTPAGVHDTDARQASLWMMAADGSGQILLRPPGLDGWAQQGHAEWSADGGRLVMFGGKVSNPQIHVTNSRGQRPRAITRRGGASLDPSFSPDGRQVAFVGCPRSFCRVADYEVYVTGLRGGPARRLTRDRLRDQDPYFSPDGRYLAWLTRTSTSPRPGGSWNIRLAAADGSGQRRLTDDAEINSKPEWSRDSTTVFFHRFVRGSSDGFDIYAVDAQGGPIRPVTVGQPGVNEFPST